MGDAHLQWDEIGPQLRSLSFSNFHLTEVDVNHPALYAPAKKPPFNRKLPIIPIPRTPPQDLQTPRRQIQAPISTRITRIRHNELVECPPIHIIDFNAGFEAHGGLVLLDVHRNRDRTVVEVVVAGADTFPACGNHQDIGRRARIKGNVRNQWQLYGQQRWCSLTLRLSHSFCTGSHGLYHVA